jgi:hypothetical protein
VRRVRWGAYKDVSTKSKYVSVENVSPTIPVCYYPGLFSNSQTYRLVKLAWSVCSS